MISERKSTCILMAALSRVDWGSFAPERVARRLETKELLARLRLPASRSHCKTPAVGSAADDEDASRAAPRRPIRRPIRRPEAAAAPVETVGPVPTERDAEALRAWLASTSTSTAAADPAMNGGWGAPLAPAVAAMYEALGPGRVDRVDAGVEVFRGRYEGTPVVFRPFSAAALAALAATWARDALLARCGELDIDVVTRPLLGSLETVSLSTYAAAHMDPLPPPPVEDALTAAAYAAVSRPRPFVVQAVEDGVLPTPAPPEFLAPPTGHAVRPTTQRVASLAGLGKEDAYPGTIQLVAGPNLAGAHLHAHGAAWNVSPPAFFFVSKLLKFEPGYSRRYSRTAGSAGSSSPQRTRRRSPRSAARATGRPRSTGSARTTSRSARAALSLRSSKIPATLCGSPTAGSTRRSTSRPPSGTPSKSGIPESSPRRVSPASAGRGAGPGGGGPLLQDVLQDMLKNPRGAGLVARGGLGGLRGTSIPGPRDWRGANGRAGPGGPGRSRAGRLRAGSGCREGQGRVMEGLCRMLPAA